MIVLCIVILILLLGSWLVLNYLSGGKSNLIKIPMEGLRLRKMVTPMLYILDRLRITIRFPFFFYKVQRSIQKIHGMRYSGEMTLLYLGEMMCYSWLLLGLGCVMSIGMGDNTGLILGVGLAILVPAAMVKDLHRQVQVRDQDIDSFGAIEQNCITRWSR